MDFNEFLPKEEEIIKEKSVEKIGQTQFYDLVTSRKPDWQVIIYELINSEQLDPWDINIVVLTNKYFEKIEELDDFYISSKLLLAASLLLRLKSEFLLNKHLRSIDDILFGKKEETKYVLERIEINEDDLPVLIPKTPLPRARRITLPELMEALGKAINTESRRIRREVVLKRARKLSEMNLPTFRRTDLNDRIKQFYARVLTSVKKISISNEEHHNKIGFSDLIGKSKEEKLASFLPLLHLSNSKKLWLEQEKHLDEIWIFLYTYFDSNRDRFLKDLEELEEELDKVEEIHGAEEGEEMVEESALDKARRVLEEKKKLQEEVARELAEEFNIE